MKTIRGILFEPVGCLAEFPPEPFLEMAAQLSGRKRHASKSGSRAYWHLLNTMQEPLPHGHGSVDLELDAVKRASLYEDVIPALTELKAMGIQLIIASSLSQDAIAHFLEGCPHEFDAVWTRDNSHGIKAEPLRCAVQGASLKPEQTIFLTDTAEGLKVAESVGVNPVLMMNDPDESRRLAMHKPAGGIVSLHELPDFIRIVQTENVRSF
jgi:phosphoglycolate phosphatase-like HAD superfamily hydrolase